MGRAASLSDFRKPPADLPEGMPFTVKLQRPLLPGRSWMAYAENMEHLRLYKAEQLPAWVLETMRGQMKRYFVGTISKGEWRFLRVADVQDADASW
jgi:hypothetical protein